MGLHWQLRNLGLAVLLFTVPSRAATITAIELAEVLPQPAADAPADTVETAQSLISPAGSGPTPPGRSAWAGTLELYGFAPLHTTSRTTINGYTVDADFNLGQALRALTAAFSVRGSVEYGRLGLMSDVSVVNVAGERAHALPSGRQAAVSLLKLRDQRPWFERLRGERFGRLDGLRLAALRERLLNRPQLLSDRQVTRTLHTTLDSQQGLYDIALRYRFGDRERAVARAGALTVVPYAGVRIVDQGLTITNALSRGSYQLRGRSDSFGQPYTQALAGVWGQVFIAPRLRLFARGDLGSSSAGGGSDLSANAQLGLGYAIGNSTQLDLSWRYLHLDRDNGQEPRDAYQLNQNGVELGLKVFF